MIPAFYRAQIVAVANEVGATLSGGFSAVQTLIDEHDLVFAVWQDAREPNGVGILLVKGQARLRDIVASGKADGMDMTAIPCVSSEQAEALRQVAGEPDRRH